MSRIRDTSGKKRRNRVAGAAENRYFCKYNEHQYAALMTKAEIVKQIAGQTGLESKMVAGVVEALLERIRAAQIGGQNVYFRGFGSFVREPRRRPATSRATRPSSCRRIPSRRSSLRRRSSSVLKNSRFGMKQSSPQGTRLLRRRCCAVVTLRNGFRGPSVRGGF